MLEIGKNSYVNIAEADELVNSNVVFDSIGSYWTGLTDHEKESFLTTSTLEIERLPVAGVKLFYHQPLQFPRRATFYRESSIPSEVKLAQVLNAVELFRQTIKAGDFDNKGRVLTSDKAEKVLTKWTNGGFKLGGGFRAW